MNYFRIGEDENNLQEYDVVVTGIEETFEILYDDTTGRTLATGARMTLSPLGTFVGHKVTVKRKSGYESVYDDLFAFLMKPRNKGVFVEVAHDQDVIKYEAYVSKGGRKVNRIDEKAKKVYWGEMTLNIVPIEAQIAP